MAGESHDLIEQIIDFLENNGVRVSSALIKGLVGLMEEYAQIDVSECYPNEGLVREISNDLGKIQGLEFSRLSRETQKSLIKKISNWVCPSLQNTYADDGGQSDYANGEEELEDEGEEDDPTPQWSENENLGHGSTNDNPWDVDDED